jgi:hypothetical protein
LRSYFVVIGVIVLMFAVGGTAHSDSSAFWKDSSGSWGGDVHQKNPDDQFHADLTLHPPEKDSNVVGQITLPNFECTAELHLTRVSATTLNATVKTLTNPVSECPEGGTVMLEMSGKDLLFIWNNKKEDTAIAGTLSKKN